MEHKVPPIQRKCLMDQENKEVVEEVLEIERHLSKINSLKVILEIITDSLAIYLSRI
jgi:hypothetical protein